ncbi:MULTISPECIES: hypothetical protein [Oscillatoriales]|nr:hypothetical protein [Oscillatoria nigro-viridis]
MKAMGSVRFRGTCDRTATASQQVSTKASINRHVANGARVS